jgi:Zn-dependent protease with chaperone function
MHFKIVFVLFISFFLVNSGYSQSTDYSPLKCKGNIPQDFLELSSSKVKRDNEIIKSSKLTKKEKAYQKEFSYNTNYGVDQILLSGQVIYGDPLTEYINQLADIILKDDPELRKQLRFYTLKSDIPNAFTTNQGIIFVTVGLMAQVENEAQLAFILCHEIIHYTAKHNYLSFKKAKKLKKSKYNRTDIKYKLNQLYNYSKANELEADKKGFELFQKTPYNASAAISSFDMLLYSYLPFEEVEWKPNYFEDSFYRFPKKLTLETVKEISVDDENEDEYSTHPNISKRKSELTVLLDTSNQQAPLFLTPVGAFDNFQHLARIEMAYIFIIQGAFEKAFYHAYLLEIKYQDYLFSNKIKAMAYYGLYKHKLANDNFEFGNYKNCEGESQRAYFLFNTFDGKELAVLASREIWKYYLENKEDDFLKTLAYESLTDVFLKAKLTKTYFDKTYKSKSKDVSNDMDKKETKVEKLKKKKQKIIEENDDTINYSKHYLSRAYINLYKNNEFQKAINSIKVKEEIDIEEVKVKKGFFSKSHKTYFGSIGSDTLILLNPSYKGPVNKAGIRNLMVEEKKEIYLANIYKDLASKNDIHLNMFNSLDKENLNTEYWNTFMIYSSWLRERLSNDTITMQLFFKNEVSLLFNTYKTNYLGISGINYLGGSGYNIKGIGGDDFFSYGKNNIYYYMGIYDTKTSQLKYLEYQGFISRMNPSFLKGLIYNSFYSLKSKKK